MAVKFTKLTRVALRQLSVGQKLVEQGIEFERLPNGDGRYSVNVMVENQRIHRVIGKESDGTTRTQAEEFVEKIKRDAREGRLNLPKGRKIGFTVTEAARAYLDKLKQEGGRNLGAKTQQIDKTLIPLLGNLVLHKVTGSDIECYKKTRLETGVQQSTVNRELATVSHLFSKALEWGWLESKPLVKKFKENASKITYLTVEQADRLLQAAKADQNSQVYLFILIGLETGMRRMEILSIKREHIDLERKIIHIPQAKAGMRQQPMTSRLAGFLAEHLKSADTEQVWLFPATKNNSASGHTMWIEKAFRRVVEAAGMNPKEILRHTLRHTAITHLVQAGIDLPTVKRISGHKTLQMVERYSHQNGAHIQAAMDKLEARYKRVEEGGLVGESPLLSTILPIKIGTGLKSVN